MTKITKDDLLISGFARSMFKRFWAVPGSDEMYWTYMPQTPRLFGQTTINGYYGLYIKEFHDYWIRLVKNDSVMRHEFPIYGYFSNVSELIHSRELTEENRLVKVKMIFDYLKRLPCDWEAIEKSFIIGSIERVDLRLYLQILNGVHNYRTECSLRFLVWYRNRSPDIFLRLIKHLPDYQVKEFEYYLKVMNEDRLTYVS